MSVAMEDCGINWHTHDPGVVLTHLAVAIADGADCLADIAALKEQEVRHTVAALMLEGGADIRCVAEMLGHTRLENTQR